MGCKAEAWLSSAHKEPRGFILPACTHCPPNAPHCSQRKRQSSFCRYQPTDTEFLELLHAGLHPSPIGSHRAVCAHSIHILAALCSPVLHTPSPCGPMHFVPPLSPHPKIPAKPIRSQSSFPRCAHNRISYFPSGDVSVCVQLPLPAHSSKPPRPPAIPTQRSTQPSCISSDVCGKAKQSATRKAFMGGFASSASGKS